MICDKLENAKLYYPLGERIALALRFLEETDFTNLPVGRHTIDGDDMYALINDYETRNAGEALPEAHRIYADIQYVFNGRELIGFAPFKNQRVQKEYDKEKDIVFYDAQVSFQKLEAGMFAIIFPGELHTPGIKDGETGPVRKVVMKVKI